ncbi:pentatricopeptide repeat-containing protein chloroplastic [Dorcoceras hygrometricum]|uniref:Pentatricopeptide repeat-containing protein chloroplastic n=1 Tax=Dorcoceras hygrometricum TaxID=472368 RepID=A0A2Z7CBF8_9LAMI|nr:pentatricopeptide repeat-containing protein chloroplastic [Dorcoceras hygrometricum]
MERRRFTLAPSTADQLSTTGTTAEFIHGTALRESFEQQLFALPLLLKCSASKVANKRANQGESSATKIVKNRGWMRWELAIESYGEQ